MSKKKRFTFFGIILLFVVGLCLIFCCKKTQSIKETLIVFNNAGNVSEYVTTGFSHPEKGFTWTQAKEVTVEIPTPKLQENYGLVLSVKMFPFSGVKKQDIDLFVNDKFITKWTVNKTDVYTAVLPDDIKNQGDVINIKFIISNPKSPKELKMSDDARKLGVAVQTLSLTPFDLNNPNNFATYDIGDEILFTKGNGAEKYMASGWSTPEQNFTWTNGKDAVVNMFVKDAKDKQLQLSVSGRAVYGPSDKNQKVVVYVNDKELTAWEIGKENAIYTVKLPESVVQNGALQIRLHISKPTKVGKDPRDLGVAVNTLKVSQMFAAKTKNKMANWFKNKVLPDSESGQSAGNNK